MPSRYLELTYELAGREVKARYKQSVLGYAWVILNPLAQMLVMAFVFGQIIRFPDLGVPYPLFLYAGLLPWNLLAGSLISATNSLVDNRSLLSKVYFPREIFIISALSSKTIDFLLASTVFIAFMVAYGTPVSWHVLWFIPIFLIQQLFTFGLALFLSAFNLFYRDIQYLLSLLLIIWMYLTPVIYPVELIPPAWRWIFSLNPMAVLINAYRQVVLGSGAPNLASLTLALVISLVLTFVGYRVFKRLEGVFADVV